MSINTNQDLSIKVEDLFCPIRYALDIVGGKWKLPILCMLADGKPARYSVIKRKLENITNMMLSQSLKELEMVGIVHREQYNEIPPRVEYSITDKGKSITPILVQFATWGADNMKTDNDTQTNCGKCISTT